MQEAAGSSTIRVATLNLWGRQGAWDERRAVLVEGLHRLRPDVIAFQDVIKSEGYDQVTDLLGAGYQVAHQSNRAADGSGVSIASRWEVEDVRELDLRLTSRAAGLPYAALVAQVLAPEPLGPLLVVNQRTAFPFGGEHERELQAVATARFVEELIGERGERHVVLASDLNASPGSASVRFWRGLQSLGETSVCYQDAWESAHPGEPGHTFTPRNPLVAGGEMPLELGRRIDYVMVRCVEHGPTLAVTACELIFEEPVDGVWASDHFGVVADLAIP
jgi:endonuclease/exonuclease/phosphatase family metal-dependent hydrolase